MSNQPSVWRFGVDKPHQNSKNELESKEVSKDCPPAVCEKPGGQKDAKAICTTCCEKWLVFKVIRLKKWGHRWKVAGQPEEKSPEVQQANNKKAKNKQKDKNAEKPITDEGVSIKKTSDFDKRYPKANNWGMTEGIFRLEIWDSEPTWERRHENGQLLLEGSTIEAGGEETTDNGTYRLIPEKDYDFSMKNRGNHSTYEAFVNPKTIFDTPRIAFRIRDKNTNSPNSPITSRTIDVHTGLDQSWTQGCILVGKKGDLHPIGDKGLRYYANTEMIYEGEQIGRASLQDSYDTVKKLLEYIHQFYALIYEDDKNKNKNLTKLSTDERLRCARALFINQY